jgi:hypothetical protein
MATVTLTVALPEALAERARQAGLLNEAAIIALLEQALSGAPQDTFTVIPEDVRRALAAVYGVPQTGKRIPSLWAGYIQGAESAAEPLPPDVWGDLFT